MKHVWSFLILCTNPDLYQAACVWMTKLSTGTSTLCELSGRPTSMVDFPTSDIFWVLEDWCRGVTSLQKRIPNWFFYLCCWWCSHFVTMVCFSPCFPGWWNHHVICPRNLHVKNWAPGPRWTYDHVLTLRSYAPQLRGGMLAIMSVRYINSPSCLVHNVICLVHIMLKVINHKYSRLYV